MSNEGGIKKGRAAVGLGLIVTALLLQIGRGWSGGGGLIRTGTERLSMRLGADGLTIEGKSSAIESVPNRIRGKRFIELTVTGAARQGDFDTVKRMIEESGVPFQIKEAR